MATGNKSALAPASAPKKTIIGIKVKFELNAKNGLRRVIFGLEKDTNGDNVKWTIKFELLERAKKSEAYGDPLVKLEVEVEAKLNSKAQAIAENGPSALQSAHALGPAADDAKAAKAGQLPKKEAEKTVQATLKKK